jgi:hypothetical protein
MLLCCATGFVVERPGRSSVRGTADIVVSKRDPMATMLKTVSDRVGSGPCGKATALGTAGSERYLIQKKKRNERWW